MTALSALLLAAHFFRSGRLLLAGIALLIPWLLLTRTTWGRRAVQVCLSVGVVEWVRTGFVFVQERRTAGAPWERLALILGAVALLTASAALALRPRSPRAAARPEPPAA